MKVSGLLAVKIPVQDFDYSAKWFKKILGYSRVFGEFFYENEYSTEKLTFVLSADGGLPVILSQQLYSEVSEQQRPSVSYLGVLAFKMRSEDIKKHYLRLKANNEAFLEKLAYSYFEKPCFWLSDNNANLYQVIEDDGPQGIYGLIINVNDIEQAQKFFSKLGFKEFHSSYGYFEDLKTLGFSHNMKANRVILRSEERHVLFNYTGITEIDLVQIEDNRQRKVFSRYSVYFFATEAHIRPDDFVPQYRVIDNDYMLALFAPIDYEIAKLRVVELRTLKFKDFFELDLTKEHSSPLPRRRLSMLLNNVLEKLD